MEHRKSGVTPISELWLPRWMEDTVSSYQQDIITAVFIGGNLICSFEGDRQNTPNVVGLLLSFTFWNVSHGNAKHAIWRVGLSLKGIFGNGALKTQLFLGLAYIQASRLKGYHCHFGFFFFCFRLISSAYWRDGCSKPFFFFFNVWRSRSLDLKCVMWPLFQRSE